MLLLTGVTGVTGGLLFVARAGWLISLTDANWQVGDDPDSVIVIKRIGDEETPGVSSGRLETAQSCGGIRSRVWGGMPAPLRTWWLVGHSGAVV